jgi:hypothetical protein
MRSPPTCSRKWVSAPSGFLGVVGEVRRKLPVLASYDALPAELRAVVEDYRLLQYDLLVEKQYALLGPMSHGELLDDTWRMRGMSLPPPAHAAIED